MLRPTPRQIAFQDDKVYFETHPTAITRVRRYIEGEFWGCMSWVPEVKPWATLVWRAYRGAWRTKPMIGVFTIRAQGGR